MPRTITLPQIPGGYLAAPSFGGEATAFVTEFLTTEDRADFIQRAEGITTVFGHVFAALRVRPSQIDHFLAVIRPDRDTTVYCNELRFNAACRRRTTSTHDVPAGTLIGVDDIADIEQVVPEDASGNPVVIPPECGIVFVFSHNWRKGVYYDYGVLREDSDPRTIDLPRLFGHFFGRLVFQEMYAITEDQWRRLLNWGWFPFIGLTHDQRRTLLSFARYDCAPEGVVAPMCRVFGEQLGERLETWRRNGLLNTHMDFLVRARERYEAGDYLSCLSVLIPRVEGVLRALFSRVNPGQKPGQNTMVSALVENRHVHSLLLPNRFDESTGDLELSRNSHGHGVSQAEDYDFVRATVAFLTLDQIYHYLSD